MTARAKNVRSRSDAQRGPSLRMQRLVRRFPLATGDASGDVWDEEVTIVKRLLLGQKLVCSRSYLESESNYAVSWYWSVEPVPEHRRAQLSVKAWNRGCDAWSRRWYPRQWDAPVMRLMGREILRPMTCAGGYTQSGFPCMCRPIAAFAALLRTPPCVSTVSKCWLTYLSMSVRFNPKSMTALTATVRPMCRVASIRSVRKSRKIDSCRAIMSGCCVSRIQTSEATTNRGNPARVSHHSRIACKGCMMVEWSNAAGEPQPPTTGVADRKNV